MDKLTIRNTIISYIKDMSMEDILEIFANVIAAILAEKHNFKFTNWSEFSDCIQKMHQEDGYTVSVAAGLQTMIIIEWIYNNKKK